MKPLLLLDIDGVICPFGGDVERLDGYEWREGLLESERISPRNAARLRALMRSFRLVWATSWQEQANEVMAPVLELPPLPYIDFASAVMEPGASYKLAPVREYVADRPFAWIDDEIREDAFLWASRREAPTLLIRTDPSQGMTDEHFEALDAFVKQIGG